MKRLLTVACGLVLALSIGCGGAAESTTDNVKRQVDGKLDAMKQLADAVEKGDRTAMAAAIEGLTSNALDAKANPDVAKEFLNIYNTRVKNKLKGDEANQVKAAVDGVENQLKK